MIWKFLKLNHQKTNNAMNKRAKRLPGHFPKESIQMTSKNMKMLVIRKIQVTTTRMAWIKKTGIDDDMEERECLYRAGGNMTWHTTYRAVWLFLKRSATQLLYGSATLPQGICSTEMKIRSSQHVGHKTITLHESQNMETTRMSSCWGTDNH